MLLDLTKVKVSQRETNEMHERLSNWDKLHQSLVEDPPSIEELVKLMAVEVNTRGRDRIMDRLLGMYHRMARLENRRAALKLCLKA